MLISSAASPPRIQLEPARQTVRRGDTVVCITETFNNFKIR